MKEQITESKLDLKYLFFRFYRNWYYFLAALAIALLTAFVFIKLSKKTYAVSSTILVERDNAGSRGAEEILEIVNPMKKEVEMEDEIGLLTSYGMVQKAIERLDFGVSYFEVTDSWFNTFGSFQVEEKSSGNFPFRVVLEPSANQLLGTPIYIKILSKNKYQLRVETDEAKLYSLAKNEVVGEVSNVKINKILTLGEPYTDKNLNFKVFLSEDYASYKAKDFYFTINNLSSLTKKYQGKVVAKAIAKDSRILQLTTEGEAPEKEIRFLDTLMNVYRNEDLREKKETGLKTVAFIDSQLDKVTTDLNTTETSLQTFKDVSNLPIGVDKVNVYEKLDELNTNSSTLNNKLREYRSILNSLEGSTDLNTFVPPPASSFENPALLSAMTELSLLYKNRADLKSNGALPGYPALQKVESQLTAQQASVISNLRQLIGSTQSDLSIVNQRIGQLQSNVQQLPEIDRKLVDLTRKFQQNDETYKFYVNKRAEAAIELATNQPSKRVIDRAKMLGNGPISPKTGAIYLIAVLAGLLIPAGFIIATDMLDDTVKSKEDVKELTRIPVLGLIGHTDSKQGILPKMDNSKSALSESFRSLRVNLQYLAVGAEHKAIGITSAISGEGKTFCSINLSTVLAISGKRTIVIDADMRKPRIAAYLGLKNTTGLSSYLIKHNTLEEVIQPTKIKNLDVITSGPIPPNPVELMELNEMKDLIAKLKQDYDYIIIDTPPIGYVSDYMVVKDYVDANIFIVRSSYTKRNTLEIIDELYENKKIKNLSIVINDIKFSSLYGYSYKEKAYTYTS